MAERLKVGNTEINIGSHITFNVTGVDGSGISNHQGVVEDIRGGGFYGKALLFPDFVVKTTEPDPWHLLWRRVNRLASHGSVIFPPQVAETAAQLDSLSTRMIHKTIPYLTEGRVTSPDSFGYTQLESLGFAQVVERMNGRGAKFNAGSRENAKFEEIRQRIWNLGITLGLEQAAQVHPENPFGKPNLWTTDGENFIWLDTLPAIPHTGFVLPAFNFGFHKDVRQRIGNGDLTFNRIHTDRFRSGIRANPGLIPTKVLDELDFYATLYDGVWEASRQELSDERGLLINFAVKNRVINPSQAGRISNSNVEYYAFVSRMIIDPAVKAFTDFAENTPVGRVFSDEQFRRDIARFISDPQFRANEIIKNTTLKGIEDAHQLGLISGEEYDEAWRIFQTKNHGSKLATTYLFLQSYYLVTGAIINSISIPVIASSVIAENPMARLSLGLFIDLVVPSIVRAASTAAVGLATRQDLKAAIIASSIPKAGSYIGVPADVAHKFGKQSELIWHYTKRGIIASLSKILRPWGGWNSDLEESLWEVLRVEKW